MQAFTRLKFHWLRSMAVLVLGGQGNCSSLCSNKEKKKMAILKAKNCKVC